MPVDPPADKGSPPGAPERLRGRLVCEPVGAGSKSERVAPQLALPGGEQLVLRRAGANPFHDPELEALEGQVLIVEGERRASYFLVLRFQVGGDDDAGRAPGAA